jgi:hypothetical protein
VRTVPLHGKKAAGRVVRVDDADHDLVMTFRWNIREVRKPGRRRMNGPYAVTRVVIGGRVTSLYMHVLIMGVKGVDHIDHDGLNNQRYNLRPATQVQNGGNQRPPTGKTSAYKGVYRHRASGKWRAGIGVNRKHIHLGTFASELDAACAYDAAAREHFGEYAYTNFPEPPEGDDRELESRLF